MATDLAHWVERWAEHRPDAVALEQGDERLDYAALASRVLSRAAQLAGAGVGPGDRVAVLAYNHPAVVEVLLACARLAAVMVPLNHRLTAPELWFILDDAEPSALLVDPRLAPAVRPAWDGPAFDLDPPAADAGGAGAGPGSWRRGRPEDPVLLVYTAGTTGRPKGAVLDQRGLAANAVHSAHCHDLTSADRILTVLPLFHVGGLNIQTMPALHAGAAVRLHERFEAGAWLADVAAWRPTLSLLVPAAMDAIVDHPGFASTDLSSLRAVQTGSTVVPVALLRAFLDRGVPVGQVYGCTETGPIATYLRAEEGERHLGSCGRPGVGTELRIVDTAGDDVAAGVAGEVWVRGDHVTRGYWRNPGATAAALADGWFRTGDVGHLEPGGWLRIDDRLGDMLITGGENVYPAELEQVLAECSELAEASVVGRADERWGEVPVVVAVRRQGSTIDAGGVLALFEGRLARYKHPRDVVFVEGLPRNAMGKVLKAELRAAHGGGVPGS